MSVAATETPGTRQLVSADELLTLPNEKDFELVNGQLVEQQMGFESSYIAGQLFGFLFLYNQTHRLGWLQGSDCGYVLPLRRENNTIRKPDVSFISFHTLPLGKGFPEGYPKLAPDLAVEVLSPHDLAYEIEAKIKDYLEAGVKLIWIINPDTRTVSIYRQNGNHGRQVENEVLDGEDVLPGFGCAIGTLFEVPRSST